MALIKLEFEVFI